MGSSDFRKQLRARAKRLARHQPHQRLYQEETRLEMVQQTALFTAAIVAVDRKKTLTVEKFIQAMDRLEELIISLEIAELLRDPDAPEVGQDDQYVVCGILMHWKQLNALVEFEKSAMLDSVRCLRDMVSAGGLEAIGAPEDVIERRARSSKHAAVMHVLLQDMLAQLAANRARMESTDDDE